MTRPLKHRRPSESGYARGEETRARILKERGVKKVPEAVQFVCDVGCGNGKSDGVVDCVCQWTSELQEQGIPAVRLATSHRKVMREPQDVRALAELVRTAQPRWEPGQVEAMRRQLRVK